MISQKLMKKEDIGNKHIEQTNLKQCFKVAFGALSLEDV